MRSHSVGPIRALDHAFVIETDDERLAAQLSGAFSRMVAPDVVAGTVYGVRVGDLSVSVGDGQPRRFRHAHEVMPWLMWRINHDVVETADGAVLHGAAVATKSGTAVICGRSGAGKSTLTAALTMTGLTYLTDEAVAVGDDGSIRYWLRPLSLSEGSLRLVADLAGVAVPEGMEIGAHGERLVSPHALGSAATSPAPPVRAVVLLDAEGGPELRRLTAARGVVAMSHHVLKPRPLDIRTVRALGAVQGRAVTCQLGRSGLAAMVDAVHDTLDFPWSER